MGSPRSRSRSYRRRVDGSGARALRFERLELLARDLGFLTRGMGAQQGAELGEALVALAELKMRIASFQHGAGYLLAARVLVEHGLERSDRLPEAALREVALTHPVGRVVGELGVRVLHQVPIEAGDRVI